jgi:tetratricopeptide (TPR) repeat protein
MEHGQSDMAARTLHRALEVEYDVEDELIGIYYLMGRAQEDLGNPEDAVEFYEKVFSLDINFEDVTERLRALR